MADSNPSAGFWRAHLRTILTAITIIALIILIYGLRKQIVDVIANLRKVNTWALLLMIPLQIGNYDAYTRFYKRLFNLLGEKIDYWPLFKTVLELNFVNHILPSGGVSGISYFTLRMRNHGISGTRATLSQVAKIVFLYVSFLPILILGIFLLSLRGHVNNLIILAFSSLITLLVVATFVVAYVVESRVRIKAFLTFITKVLNWLIRLVKRSKSEPINIQGAQKAFEDLHDNYLLLRSKWRALKWPFIHMLYANATEIATVYIVYIAFGKLVNVGAVILAYAIANFAGAISVLPAGIGVYEGLMTAVLAATGIPVSLSIPVTIMYRVVNMFIQLTPGYILYQRALGKGWRSKV